MWSKLLSCFFTTKIPVKPEPIPDEADDFDFTPTPNIELRLKSLNLTEDKVQRIFLDHAFRYYVRDYYDIMHIREKEMRDKDEFLPEELEQLRIEYEIIGLILESERKDFFARCGLNHLDLLRKLAKTIIRLNPVIDKNKNPDLEVFWLENKDKLLLPINDRLKTVKLKILYELIAANILKEEEPKPVASGTSDTTPPKIIGPDSDDIVMDSDTSQSGKAEEKKSTLNFN